MSPTLATLFLAGSLTPFVPAPKPKDGAKRDLKDLQGTWQMVRYELSGRPLSAEAAQRYQVVISGDRWEFVLLGVLHGASPRPKNEFQMKLDAKKKPRVVELTHCTAV